MAIGWILLGLVAPVDVAGLTPLYLGEVVALYAFAASWLVKGHDLRRLLPWRRRQGYSPVGPSASSTATSR